MHPSTSSTETSRHRHRLASSALLIALALAMTACSIVERDAAGEPFPLLGDESPLAWSSREEPGEGPFYEGRDVSESSRETSSGDRQASIFYNKMRVCVKNNTPGAIEVDWNAYMQSDTGAYLAESQLEKTVSPSATECAISYASGGTEEAKLGIAGHPVTAINSGGAGFKLNFGGTNTSLVPGKTLKQELVADGKPSIALEAATSGVLTTFTSVKAYPIDLRVVDAR